MIYYYLHPLKPLYMVTELLATQPQPQVMIKSTNVMQSLNKYKNFTYLELAYQVVLALDPLSRRLHTHHNLLTNSEY